MKQTTLNYLIDFVKDQSGIVLSHDKAYLLESRLLPIAKKYHFTDIDSLVDQVKMSKNTSIEESIVDAMTTNESFFFRDTKPFDQFRNEIIPSLVKRQTASRKIRIWSAAASTGQEPYSLAIILNEMSAELKGFNVEIIGTDISQDALTRARTGLFTQFEVQRGLSTQRLVKFFKKNNDNWEINQEIKRNISFKIHNLLKNNRSLGNFDVIFIRNVLIYFDIATKRKILEELAGMISEDGFICLGGTETILGITDKLVPCPHARGLYQKKKECTSNIKVA